jgi:hypothetical protein
MWYCARGVLRHCLHCLQTPVARHHVWVHGVPAQGVRHGHQLSIPSVAQDVERECLYLYYPPRESLSRLSQRQQPREGNVVCDRLEIFTVRQVPEFSLPENDCQALPLCRAVPRFCALHLPARKTHRQPSFLLPFQPHYTLVRPARHESWRRLRNAMTSVNRWCH